MVTVTQYLGFLTGVLERAGEEMSMVQAIMKALSNMTEQRMVDIFGVTIMMLIYTKVVLTLTG